MQKSRKFTIKVEAPKKRTGHHTYKSANQLVFADKRTKRLKTRQTQKNMWKDLH